MKTETISSPTQLTPDQNIYDQEPLCTLAQNLACDLRILNLSSFGNNNLKQFLNNTSHVEEVLEMKVAKYLLSKTSEFLESNYFDYFLDREQLNKNMLIHLQFYMSPTARLKEKISYTELNLLTNIIVNHIIINIPVFIYIYKHIGDDKSYDILGVPKKEIKRPAFTYHSAEDFYTKASTLL